MRSKRKEIHHQAEKLIRETIKLNSSKTKKKGSLISKIGYLVFPGGFIVLYVSIGLWSFCLGLSDYPAATDFENKAVATTGIITETNYESRTISSGGFPNSYIVVVPTIQFKTSQGEFIRFRGDDDLCTRSCRGEEVQLFYASDNPHLVMVKGGSSPIDRARSKIGCGIFFVLFGIFNFIIAPSEYGGRFGPSQR
jgi:Protein of unknown function (DUF3592)